MQANLEKLTSFRTRSYDSQDYGSQDGQQSSEWLLSRVRETIRHAGADKHVTAEPFSHAAFPQKSIVVRIPGRTHDTVVVGAHLDSSNKWPSEDFPMDDQAAPGADEGSGAVTILEAMRVLLGVPGVVGGNQTNTVEFHWYAATGERALLGSHDIFSTYKQQGRAVKAMLNQAQTGFVQGTLDAGKPESMGVMTHHVSPELTDFIKKVVDVYCDISWVETKCLDLWSLYACSDHASATEAGYPSAFVFESEERYSNDRVHTEYDTIEYLSFNHMVQHARMTLGYAYELAHADFAKLEPTASSLYYGLYQFRTVSWGVGQGNEWVITLILVMFDILGVVAVFLVVRRSPFFHW